MKAYREKIVEVTAVQWKGQKSGEVSDFAGREEAFIIPGGIMLVKTINGSVEAEVGQWIVKSNKDVITGGTYTKCYLHLYTEEAFKDKYEEI